MNEKFIGNLESIQYNATLAVAGAIEGISNELGLKHLRERVRRQSLFHEIYNLKLPKYLCNLIASVIFFFLYNNIKSTRKKIINTTD